MTINEVIEKIINFIPKRKIFLLEGELGSGKTYLVKKISEHLKIKSKIVSPTFILWQKYEFNFKNYKYFLNHLDLYRIGAKDILKIGLGQELKKKNNIFFIEWGGKLMNYLMKNGLKFVVINIKRQMKKRDYQIKKNETFSHRR